ncbi:MAG TPA: filamentous hemagglutinin N-terminal domain-containing protein, partial [Rhodanobacter sp.]
MNTTSRTTQRTSRRSAASATATALPRLRQQRLALSLALALGSMSFCGGALAAAAGGVAPGSTPIGGVVVGGSGSITQNGVNTVVSQNSALLALNWQSFNLGKDATVLFNQPSFNAVALNRILDQNPSQIFGHINSNGQVFLINTHGIIFGSSAQLNVGGLVASKLDLTPNDFLSNHFNLDAHGGSAGVVNHGTIQAASGGSVSLVGGQVQNDGLIVANYGHINLDGADRAVLDFDGDGLIGVQVTGALQRRLSADEAAVANKGTLQADG